jgi:hypothetical protein
MKKIFFYIALGISILLLLNIIKIFTMDLNRLTQYGFGYLAGKVILFVLFMIIIFATRKHKTETKLEL